MNFSDWGLSDSLSELLVEYAAFEKIIPFIVCVDSLIIDFDITTDPFMAVLFKYPINVNIFDFFDWNTIDLSNHEDLFSKVICDFELNLLAFKIYKVCDWLEW